MPKPSWDDLLPGQYVCVRGSGLFGAVIRTVTRAPVAHVIVKVAPQPAQDGGEPYDVVEAEPGGVRFNRISSFDWSTSYPSLDVISPAQSLGMNKTALDLVGVPYGYLADAFIGIRDELGLPTVEPLFKLHAVTGHEECAQLADFVALQNGKHYFADGRMPGSVSPADLWRRQYS